MPAKEGYYKDYKPPIDFSMYDDEYPPDYKDTENFDPGLPFQDIPVTETEEEKEPPGPPPVIVYRKEWGAVDGGNQRRFNKKVENVIYSYTETDVCTTREECMQAMRDMQKDHMKQGFPDIKFNFVIGGDGTVYEGTGWDVRAPLNIQYPTVEGEHIEFAHTGYRENFPEKEKVRLINRLFDFGVEQQKIDEDARVCIDYMWDTN